MGAGRSRHTGARLAALCLGILAVVAPASAAVAARAAGPGRHGSLAAGPGLAQRAAARPPGVPSQLAPSPVTLTGTVVNGTAGATVPSGLMVTATEVDATASKQIATVAVPTSGGSFTAGPLPGDPGDRFAISTDYKGVTYVAEVKPPAAATLQIFETTTDNSNLSIPSETLTILTGKGSAFDALQIITVRNSGDRTYVGKPDPANSGVRQTLELPVPADISGFAPAGGLRGKLSVAPDGQPASSDPVLPGDTDVSYVYTVNVPRSGWSLSRPVIYPTAREEILLDPSLSLVGPGLSFRKNILIGKVEYKNYQGGALAPGTTLNATITYTSSTSTVLWTGLAILAVLVLVAAIGFPRLYRRSRRQAGALPGGPETSSESREELIEAIAALDEAHDDGTIPDEQYETTRAALKDRLLALTESADAEPESGTAPEAEPEAGAEAEPEEPEAAPGAEAPGAEPEAGAGGGAPAAEGGPGEAAGPPPPA